jgi:hypothetical protein
MKVQLTLGLKNYLIEAQNFDKVYNKASEIINRKCNICGCEEMAGCHCPACDKTYTKKEFENKFIKFWDYSKLTLIEGEYDNE